MMIRTVCRACLLYTSEGKGNYRVELFNIYGKGAADGKVLNSAFSNSQNLASEPALHFSNSEEENE